MEALKIRDGATATDSLLILQDNTGANVITMTSSGLIFANDLNTYRITYTINGFDSILSYSLSLSSEALNHLQMGILFNW